MKKIYLIISLALIFNFCNAQKKIKMEKFDVKKFEQHRVAPYENNAEYTREDGTRFYMISKGIEGYDMFETPPDPALYEFYKTFHKNTRLKTSEKRLKRGNVVLGVVNEYDENGKIIKTTDYDKPFTYSWEDVQKFCKNNGIDISNTRTSINRDCRDKCIWEIEYHGLYDNKEGMFTMKIDGKTGEIILVKQFMGKKSGPNGMGTIGEHKIIYDINDEKKKASAIYITHKGKPYTKEEWKAFEQEHHNEYLRKKGREDEIKPVDTPKTDDNKRNFLADEEDIKPQNKKGFWDSLFD
jgi:hypothetical protein